MEEESDARGPDNGEDGLAVLRARLDDIDTGLRDKLNQRLQCCLDIARHKSAFGIPMMQPSRIGFVQRKAADFAQTHGISLEFMRQFYELIISETCRMEDRLMAELGCAAAKGNHLLQTSTNGAGGEEIRERQE